MCVCQAVDFQVLSTLFFELLYLKSFVSFEVSQVTFGLAVCQTDSKFVSELFEMFLCVFT